MADVQFDIHLKNSGTDTEGLTLFAPVVASSQKASKYSFTTPYSATYLAGTIFTIIDNSGTFSITLDSELTMAQVINLLNALNIGTFLLAYNDSTNGNVFHLLSNRSPQTLSIDNFGTETWTIAATSADGPKYAVDMVSTSLGYLAGDDGTDGIVMKTTDGGNNWVDTNFPGLAKSMRGISFVNENIGWAVGDDQIFKTTDGGANWSAQTHPSAIGFLYSVHAVTANIAYAVGYLTVGIAPYIIKTTDGGANWVQQTSPVATGTLRSVKFSGTMVGWAVGYVDAGPTNLILFTLDGGANWTQQTAAGTGALYDISVIDSVHVKACGFSSGDGSIVYSTDQGINWNTVLLSSILPSGRLHGICFTDILTGWAVGYDFNPNEPIIVYTENGGITWSKIDNPIGAGVGVILEKIDFSGNAGVIVGRAQTGYGTASKIYKYNA